MNKPFATNNSIQADYSSATSSFSPSEFEPFPDEIFYSVISRYHRRSGNVSYKNTIEKLFYSPRKSSEYSREFSLNNFFSNIGLRSDRAKGRYLEKTTLFPLLRPWRNDVTNEVGYRRMSSYIKKSLLGWDEEEGIRTDNRYGLRLCQKCIESDIRNYGVSYWHRSHQVTGVSVCHIHKCRLICLVPDGSEKYPSRVPNFVLPDDLIGEIGKLCLKDFDNREDDVAETQRFASFVYLFLSIDTALTFKELWGAVRRTIERKYSATPGYLESDRLYDLFVSFVDKLGMGDIQFADSQLRSVDTFNEILINRKSREPSIIQICLIAFLFETSNQFLREIELEPSHKKQMDIDDFKNVWMEKIIEWIDYGLSTKEIGEKVSLDALDAWRVIKYANLSPNESFIWLNDDRKAAIRKLIIERNNLETIAEMIDISRDKLVIVISKSESLKNTYLEEKWTKLAKRNVDKIRKYIEYGWYSLGDEIMSDSTNVDMRNYSDKDLVKMLKEIIFTRIGRYDSSIIIKVKSNRFLEQRLDRVLLLKNRH
jgi:hypothetical protein